MRSNKLIPLSVPNLKGNEVSYVVSAVKSEWVSTAGSYVTNFEQNIAKYVGTTGAVACQSGTAGLHIAYMLCGVCREDMVIVPTLTFIAAVNPARYIGAVPVFMDCDSSLCIDPNKLEKFCREECKLVSGVLYHKESGRRIPAVVVVHVFGNMADMQRILKIASEFHLKVIEDATEALGTKYTSGPLAGKFAGSMGDIGVYSFNGNKIITTGGGGMIVSNNRKLLERAKHLTTQAKIDIVRFIHDEVGYNYRLTNLQAALGLAQLEQLEKFINIKQENYECYRRKLCNLKQVNLLDFRDGIRANYWFYSIQVRPESKKNRDELIEWLLKQNIQCRPVWGLVHQQKPYMNDLVYKIQQAIDYHDTIINVPCSTNLKEEDINLVVMNILEACL